MPYYKYDGSIAPVSGPTTQEFRGGGADTVDTLTGTAGADLLWGGPADDMRGGAGNDTYGVLGLGDRVFEDPGGGIDTVQAWRTLDLADYPNVENVSAFNPGNLARGDSGDNIVSGGDQGQQLYGGAGGQDVLIGGSGPDVFIVYKGQGNDVIQDFRPAEADILRLKAGFTDFSQIQARLTQVGADVKLDLGGGEGVMFRDLSLSQLGMQNFQLQFEPGVLGQPTFAAEFDGPLSLWDAESRPSGVWRPDFGYRDPQAIYNYNINNEMQAYVSPYYREHPGDFPINPFSVANGTLTITAQTAPSPGDPELFEKGYTSGLIASAPTFSQTYGYFEMRANVPETPGSWAAFWLAPQDGSWPPELDILESWGAAPGAALTAWHSSATGAQATAHQNQLIPGTADGWHTYGLLWTRHEVSWYVDGVQVYQTATLADMHKPMYIIANLALTNKDGPVGATPINFDIDYIRAYALPPLIAATARTADPSYTLDASETTLVMTGSAAQSGTGNDQANTLVSNSAGSTLDGMAGGDTLVAGGGGDTLAGGAGADVFAFKALPWSNAVVTDFVVGTDKVDFSQLFGASGYSGNDPVRDGYLSLSADGAGGTRLFYDPDGAATNAWPNYVVDLKNVAATTPAATLLAGNFVDSTTPPPPSGGGGTSAAAYTMGAAEQNIVLTGSASQAVTGNGLDNGMVSNDAGSALSGMAGADTLAAGRGGDTLSGGDGADVFAMKVLPWSFATVTDFTAGADRLDLSALFAASGYSGSDPVADGYLRLSSDGAGGTQVFYDPDGPGGATPWPTYLFNLKGVPATTPASSLLNPGSAPPPSSGGGTTTPPPPPPPPSGGGGTSAAAYTMGAAEQNIVLTGSASQAVTGNGLDNGMVSNDAGSALSGMAGADTLAAGRGGDTLSGGDGADVFVFGKLPWASTTLTDFTPGVDRIDLSALLDASGYTGTDPVGDGYVSLSQDGAGGTRLFFDADARPGSEPWPTHVASLKDVMPSDLASHSGWLVA